MRRDGAIHAVHELIVANPDDIEIEQREIEIADATGMRSPWSACAKSLPGALEARHQPVPAAFLFDLLIAPR